VAISCTQKNPDYCNEDDPSCPGKVCNIPTKTCVRATDEVDAGPDAADDSSLQDSGLDTTVDSLSPDTTVDSLSPDTTVDSFSCVPIARFPELCGNGRFDQGESCDDGNVELDDSCPSGPCGSCQPARCGDGFIWTDKEICDDGNDRTDDACPRAPSS